MSDVPTPDYAEEINSEYAQLRAAAEATIAHAIRLGNMLIAQKDRTKHGAFMPWVKEHCRFSHESANIYMRIAADPNSQHATNLSLREFLEKPKLLPAVTATPFKSDEDFAERVSRSMQEKPAQPFVPLATAPNKLLYCSFCGKSQHEIRKLIAGPPAQCGSCGKTISASVFVCDECVELLNGVIRKENAREVIPNPPRKAKPKAKAPAKAKARGARTIAK